MADITKGNGFVTDVYVATSKDASYQWPVQRGRYTFLVRIHTKPPAKVMMTCTASYTVP